MSEILENLKRKMQMKKQEAKPLLLEALNLLGQRQARRLQFLERLLDRLPQNSTPQQPQQLQKPSADISVNFEPKGLKEVNCYA